MNLPDEAFGPGVYVLQRDGRVHPHATLTHFDVPGGEAGSPRLQTGDGAPHFARGRVDLERSVIG